MWLTRQRERLSSHEIPTCRRYQNGYAACRVERATPRHTEDRVQPSDYDAIIIVSFGGPDRHDDVVPFLENVLRGKPVPRARLLEIAGHYYALGGKSPLNDQNRALIAALQAKLEVDGPNLPVYWGNRNWHPLLTDTLKTMADDGVARAIAFVTSAFSSYSSCRQYLENIQAARSKLGSNPPQVDKIRPFFNHPGFIGAMADRIVDALSQFDSGTQTHTKVLYTAHSIPTAMASASQYVQQLREASRLLSNRLGISDWELVFQSRSGPPAQPWLEPDICGRIALLRKEGVERVCVAPLGFLSDHMEIKYDLDTEAAEVARRVGLEFVRAGTVGTHPKFVSAVRDLIAERIYASPTRSSVGGMPPCPDVCPADCCPPPAQPGRHPRRPPRA